MARLLSGSATLSGLAHSSAGATGGISDGNHLEANANVVDNDFLRVDGTEIEGLSASETLSAVGGIGASNPTVTLGSNATFPSGMIINYASQITTISGGQALTDDYEEITGSSISYTPPATASFVIYEFNYIFSGTDSRYIGHFNIQIDGSDTSTSTFSLDNANTGGDRGTDMINVKHRLATWSGAKTIRLVGRRYSSSFDGICHQTYNLDGDATITFYDPTLNIFSVT